MAWKLVMRVNGRVDRRTYEDRAAALKALEDRGRSVAAGSRREEVTVAKRTYAPIVQVQARLEVRGPRGVTGGVDVRGDGSTEAWTGRWHRQLVEPARGEDAFAALGRALA